MSSQPECEERNGEGYWSAVEEFCTCHDATGHEEDGVSASESEPDIYLELPWNEDSEDRKHHKLTQDSAEAYDTLIDTTSGPNQTTDYLPADASEQGLQNIPDNTRHDLTVYDIVREKKLGSYKWKHQQKLLECHNPSEHDDVEGSEDSNVPVTDVDQGQLASLTDKLTQRQRDREGQETKECISDERNEGVLTPTHSSTVPTENLNINQHQSLSPVDVTIAKTHGRNIWEQHRGDPDQSSTTVQRKDLDHNHPSEQDTVIRIGDSTKSSNIDDNQIHADQAQLASLYGIAVARNMGAYKWSQRQKEGRGVNGQVLDEKSDEAPALTDQSTALTTEANANQYLAVSPYDVTIIETQHRRDRGQPKTNLQPKDEDNYSPREQVADKIKEDFDMPHELHIDDFNQSDLDRAQLASLYGIAIARNRGTYAWAQRQREIESQKKNEQVLNERTDQSPIMKDQNSALTTETSVDQHQSLSLTNVTIAKTSHKSKRDRDEPITNGQNVSTESMETPTTSSKATKSVEGSLSLPNFQDGQEPVRNMTERKTHGVTQVHYKEGLGENAVQVHQYQTESVEMGKTVVTPIDRISPIHIAYDDDSVRREQTPEPCNEPELEHLRNERNISSKKFSRNSKAETPDKMQRGTTDWDQKENISLLSNRQEELANSALQAMTTWIPYQVLPTVHGDPTKSGRFLGASRWVTDNSIRQKVSSTAREKSSDSLLTGGSDASMRRSQRSSHSLTEDSNNRQELTETNQQKGVNYMDASRQSSKAASTSSLTHFDRKKLYNMWVKGMFCDAVVTLDRQSFPVHRIILAAFSDYFEELFTKSSASSDDTGQYVIAMEGLTAETFHTILKYIYTSHVGPHVGHFCQLLSASLALSITQLTNTILKIPLEQWQNECIGVLYLAQVWGLNDLQNIARRYIRTAFSEVSISEQFIRSPAEHITSILSDDLLEVNQEVDILHAVLLWLGRHASHNNSYLSMLNYVHFESIPHESLVKLLENKADRSCRYSMAVRMYLLDALKRTSHLSTQRLQFRHPVSRQRISQVTSSFTSRTELGLNDGLGIHGATCKSCSCFKVTESCPAKDNIICPISNASTRGESITDPHPLTTDDPSLKVHREYIKITKATQCPPRAPSTTSVPDDFKVTSLQQESRESSVWQKQPTPNSSPKGNLSKQNVSTDNSDLGCIVIIGGRNQNGENGPGMNAVQKFELGKCKEWKYMTDLPVKLFHHTACVAHDAIYISGGCMVDTDGDPLDSAPLVSGVLHKFDLINKRWHRLASLDQARMMHQMVSLFGQLYAIGGVDEDDRPLSSVERYSPYTNSWRHCAPLSFPRYAVAAVAHHYRVWIAGGATVNHVTRRESAPNRNSTGKRDNLHFFTNGLISLTAVVEYYSPYNDSWTKVNPLTSPRCHASMVHLKDRMYIVGGYTSLGSLTWKTSTIDRYDDVTDRWLCVAKTEPGNYGNHTVAVGTKIVIVGKPDLTHKDVDDVISSFDTATDKWESTRIPFSEARVGHACCVIPTSANRKPVY